MKLPLFFFVLRNIVPYITGDVLYLVMAIVPAFLATMINYNVNWQMALGPIALTGALIVILLENILVAVLAVAALAVSVVFIILMQARTRKSAELLGKLLGFRDFIETAELDKLKLMVEDNPSYFYNIMPYAYVFGLSDIWIKHFEEIPLPRPNWYSGCGHYDPWDVYWYSRMMNRCMTSMDNSVSSAIDASSDSGGFGGFGGGGGSW